MHISCLIFFLCYNGKERGSEVSKLLMHCYQGTYKVSTFVNLSADQVPMTPPLVDPTEQLVWEVSTNSDTRSTGMLTSRRAEKTKALSITDSDLDDSMIVEKKQASGTSTREWEEGILLCESIMRINMFYVVQSVSFSRSSFFCNYY